MKRARVISLLVLSCLAPAIALAAAGSTVDLGGTWQSIALPEPVFPPADADGWVEVEIPRPVNAAPWVCQRRSFTIPDELEGQRFYLRFQGVKYTAKVRCNGEDVGGHIGGYEPFECDITDVAKVGEANVVEVLCGSWRQLTTDPDSDGPLGREGIEEQGDWILYPIGSHNSMGIWDTVTLKVRPAVYVGDVYVSTSVREHTITVETTVRNTTDEPVDVSLAQAALRDGKPVHSIGPERARIEAQTSAAITRQAEWDDPPLWWPHDPVLLELQTVLVVDGEPTDRHLQRFGFREMWAEGELFVLNGTPMHLLGNSCHPLGYTREDAERAYEICRKGNINAFRLHAQPWSQAWYDVADETGMLIMHETAVWCYARQYALDDQRFWDNFAEHIRAQIKLHRNRPSVFAWSLENEILHVGGSRVPETEQRLADLATVAREVDPSRLINYDGDEDQKGAADIINLHYAHNFPSSRLWPNACSWLDTERKVDGWPRKEWLWSREKPLYIGEYLWSPSSTPDPYTLFFGDEAYTDLNWYRRAAKAQAWRYQIEAYRAQGMSGGCPWNVFEGGRMAPNQNPMYHATTLAYRPQCALIEEWNTTFFSEAEVERTVTFINDVLRAAKLRAEWFCEVEGRETFRDGTDLQMEPAEIIRKTVKVAVPEVDERTPFDMVFTLSENGKEIFRETRACWAMHGDGPPKSQRTELALYDPAGETAEALKSSGIDWTAVDALGSLPEGAKCLLIGEGVFEAQEREGTVEVGGKRDVWRAVREFADQGGRVVVLAQDHMPEALPATLMGNGSTLAFIRSPNHPLVQGCEPDDFALWAPDHIVSQRDIERPARGAARVIVDAGGSTGMERALLLEVPTRRGSYVFCQLPVIAKYGVEPIARQTLHRLIKYAVDTPMEMRLPIQVIEEGDTLTNALKAAGAQVMRFTPGAVPVPKPAAVILGGVGRADVRPDLWEDYVRNGGTVWLHGPSPQYLAKLGLEWEGLSWEPGGTVPIRKVAGGPLSDGLRNEDLYWLADVRPKRHANWSLTPGIANHMLQPELVGGATEIPIDQFDNSQVAITRRTDEGIWLSTRGTITAPIEVPKDGTYVIAVIAGGTPMDGVFPAYSVHVGEQLVGGFAADRPEPRVYAVSGELLAGRHELRVSFVNDASDPPVADRNGLVAGASFAPAAAMPGEIELLTDPPILFAVNRGKGRYLIDGINWPTTGLNANRAARLLSTLITNLRISAQVVAAGTPVPLADWELDPEAAHARHTGDGGIYLGDTSWTEGSVRFAAAGDYRLLLEVRGTEADGEFPEIELSLDGEVIDAQHLVSPAWHEISFPLTVTPGEHLIRIRFTNDKYDQAMHLDRNFWLRRMAIARDDRR